MTTEPVFLIWSNQKRQWWRAARRGYTDIIDTAGRYPRGEAEAIVRDATVDGRISHVHVDPQSGVQYVVFDEVMVLAPESISAEREG